MTLDTMADVLADTDTRLATLEQAYQDLTLRLDRPAVERVMLPDLALDDQVICLMQSDRAAQWCTESALRCLAASWDNARLRALLCTAARKCGLTPHLLDGMVQQWQGETAGDGAGLTTITGSTLLTTDYAQRQDVIADVLPAGCTLLAGNAKDGKSLLAYHLAACVATGKLFLGQFPVQQGEVLFFALEDGERRGQERLRRQGEQLGVEPEAFEQIHFRFWDAPKLGLGFERLLTQWITDHPQTRLIIIDILEKIRPPRSEFAELYRTGYATTAPLTRVAQEQNVALLVVHHSNKNPHSDPRLLVSGPMSVLGGADNAWLLRRPYGEEEADLIIAGRDIPEQEWALHFAEGLWSLEGTLSDCRMSRERREVLEVLHEERAGMRPYQLALAMGKKAPSMRSLLRKMREDGLVAVDDAGLYTALVDPPSVHGVHDEASRPRVPGPLPDPAPSPPVEDRAGDAQAQNRLGTDPSMHAGNAVHAGHGSHGDDGGNAVHADHAIHADHAVHGDNADTSAHTDHAGHAMHAVHADDGEHAAHGMHAVHAPPEEPDPFLEPDDWLTERATAPPPVEEPAQASTPVQTSSSLKERPLQAKDWIWPCLPSGAKTSVS